MSIMYDLLIKSWGRADDRVKEKLLNMKVGLARKL